jgi:hypothetical protein
MKYGHKSGRAPENMVKRPRPSSLLEITKKRLRVDGSQAERLHKPNLRSSGRREGGIHPLRILLQGTASMRYLRWIRMPKVGDQAVVSSVESGRGFLASGPTLQAGPMRWRDKSAWGGHRPHGWP